MNWKASTAALRHILQSCFSSGNTHRATRLAVISSAGRVFAPCGFSARVVAPTALVRAEFLFFDRRVLRPGRNPLVVFQSFFRQLDGLFQLRIVPAHHQVRPLRHDIIRVHAVLFNHPFAAVVGAPEAESGRGDESAIAQRLHVANAH